MSYLSRSSNDDKRWVFPEKDALVDTHVDQIITTEIPVEYSCVAIIRCKLSDATVSEITSRFKAYVSSLV